MVTLNTSQPFGALPVSVTAQEPDGTKTTIWTTAEVEGQKKHRKIIGLQDRYVLEPNKEITPIEIKVEEPKSNDKYDAKNLPPGLKLDTKKKAIVGTPTQEGVYKSIVAFKGRFGLGEDAKFVEFVVGNPTPPPVIPPVVPPAPGPVPGPQPPRPTPTPSNGPSVEPATQIAGTRTSGPSRVETAVAISQQHNRPSSLDTVILARSDEFADAVAATPLAQQLKASILLTPMDFLHPATQAKIARVLKPGGKIMLMGKHAALSPTVESALIKTFPEAMVERIGGLNRFDTAAMIYEAVGSPSTVAVVDGDKAFLADGLVAGTAMAQAVRHGSPMILAPTDYGDGRVPQFLNPLIRGKKVRQVELFGGLEAISSSVAQHLTGANVKPTWEESNYKQEK